MKTLLAAVAAALIGAPAAALPTFELAGAPGSKVSAVRGLEAEGAFYDIEFVDGTCVALFDGCDDAGDFLFSADTLTDVFTALGAALVDFTVIEGVPYTLDTTPEVIQGCEADPSGLCQIWAPYALSPPDRFSTVGLANFAAFADGTTSGGALQTFDAAASATITFALIAEVEGPQTSAPVPLPAGALLLPAALAAFGAFRRRA